jgi:hypothetical protein
MSEQLKDMRELYPFFQGDWIMERWIYKNEKIVHARAYGTVQFMSGSAHQLHYEEKGKLIISGSSSEISFSRKFTYEFQKEGMDVFFADGPDIGTLYQRYIQSQNNKLIPDQIHVCSNDVYQGEYHLFDADSFSLETLIDGPHKDFLIKTSFARNFKSC